MALATDEVYNKTARVALSVVDWDGSKALSLGTEAQLALLGEHRFIISKEYTICLWAVFTAKSWDNRLEVILRTNDFFQVIGAPPFGFWNLIHEGDTRVGQLCEKCGRTETDSWMFVCMVGKGEKTDIFRGNKTSKPSLQGAIKENLQKKEVISIGAGGEFGTGKKMTMSGPGKMAWLGYWSRALSSEAMAVLWSAGPSPDLWLAKQLADEVADEEVSKAFQAPVTKGTTASLMAAFAGLTFGT